MADSLRLHNVYSNDEVRFIDEIACYLIEQGFFLQLINGGKSPVTLKQSEKTKSDIQTNVLGNLSIPAHDVVVAYLNRERLFSIVFEHDKAVIKRPEKDVIFSKYGNKVNASDVVSDVIVHQKDYSDIILSAAKQASNKFEIRPKLAEILSDKSVKDIKSDLVSRNENSACVYRVAKMIDDNEIFAGNKKLILPVDRSKLNDAVKYVTSNGYSVFLLEDDFMRPVNNEEDLKDAAGNCYAVVRSDGGVVGFLKTCVHDPLGKSRFSISVLNNIWNSDLDIHSVLEESAQKQTEDIIKFSMLNKAPTGIRTYRNYDKSNPLYYVEIDYMNEKENKTLNNVADSITELVMSYDITFDEDYKVPGFGITFKDKELLNDVYKKIGGINKNYMKLFVSGLILEDINSFSEKVSRKKDYSSLSVVLYGHQYGYFEINNQRCEESIKRNPFLKKLFKGMFRKHSLCEKELEIVSRIYRKAVHPVISMLSDLDRNRDDFVKLLKKSQITKENIDRDSSWMETLVNSIVMNTMRIIPDSEFGYKENDDIYSKEEQRLDELYRNIGGVSYDGFRLYLKALVYEIIIIRKSFSRSELCKFIERGDDFNRTNTGNDALTKFLKYIYDRPIFERPLSSKEEGDIMKLYRKKASYVFGFLLDDAFKFTSSFTELEDNLKNNPEYAEAFIEKNKGE